MNIVNISLQVLNQKEKIVKSDEEQQRPVQVAQPKHSCIHSHNRYVKLREQLNLFQHKIHRVTNTVIQSPLYVHILCSKVKDRTQFTDVGTKPATDRSQPHRTLTHFHSQPQSLITKEPRIDSGPRPTRTDKPYKSKNPDKQTTTKWLYPCSVWGSWKSRHRDQRVAPPARRQTEQG